MCIDIEYCLCVCIYAYTTRHPNATYFNRIFINLYDGLIMELVAFRYKKCLPKKKEQFNIHFLFAFLFIFLNINKSECCFCMRSFFADAC